MSAYGLTREQSVELLVRTSLEYGVTDRRQIAYIVATAQHETDNFNTSREYDGPRQAIRNGYEGGENYYGRGYVQVTHDRNYDQMAATLGDSRIRSNPDIVAEDANLGAQTTVVGMSRGLYTGVGLDRYINSQNADYTAARATVNGTDRDADIAALARTWEQNLPSIIDRVTAQGVTPRAMPGSPMADGSLSVNEKGPEVARMQEALRQRGFELTPDGVYGNGTRGVVEQYQRQSGLPATGTADSATLNSLGVTQIVPLSNATTPTAPQGNLAAAAVAAASAGVTGQTTAPEPQATPTPSRDVGADVAARARELAGTHFKPGETERCQDFVNTVLNTTQPGLADRIGTTRQAVDGLESGELLASRFFGRDVSQPVTDLSRARPGDIVGFANTYGDYPKGTITHVGIYVGDGMVVDRPTADRPVQMRSIETFGADNFVVMRPNAYGLTQSQDLPATDRPAQSQNPAAAPQAAGMLMQGDTGQRVTALQEALNKNGAKLEADGNFGPATKAAVESYQRSQNLDVDGIAGSRTLAALGMQPQTQTAAQTDKPQTPQTSDVVAAGLAASVAAVNPTATPTDKPANVQPTPTDKPQTPSDVVAAGLAASVAAVNPTAMPTDKPANVQPTPTDKPQTPSDVVAAGLAASVAAVNPTATPTDKPQTSQTSPTPPDQLQPPTQSDKSLMSNPNHPDNKLYHQAVSNLEQLGPTGGFKSREDLEKAAAAVAGDAKATGLQSIDHISKTNAPNGQSYLVAVQGDPTSPASKNSYIDFNQATSQTVQQSTQMADAQKPAIQLADQSVVQQERAVVSAR